MAEALKPCRCNPLTAAQKEELAIAYCQMCGVELDDPTEDLDAEMRGARKFVAEVLHYWGER